MYLFITCTFTTYSNLAAHSRLPWVPVPFPWFLRTQMQRRRRYSRRRGVGWGWGGDGFLASAMSTLQLCKFPAVSFWLVATLGNCQLDMSYELFPVPDGILGDWFCPGDAKSSRSWWRALSSWSLRDSVNKKVSAIILGHAEADARARRAGEGCDLWPLTFDVWPLWEEGSGDAETCILLKRKFSACLCLFYVCVCLCNCLSFVCMSVYASVCLSVSVSLFLRPPSLSFSLPIRWRSWPVTRDLWLMTLTKRLFWTHKDKGTDRLIIYASCQQMVSSHVS